MAELIPVCESKTAQKPELLMGWFSLARSQELQVGEVKNIHACERDLVLYRTRSGQVAVHDAYCPHLGANLGVKGTVVGETIRCPFHGWRFSADDGECIEIPYCDKIPDRAKLRTWPSQEINGEIYFWYHPRGEAPLWQIPVIDELADDNWSAPRQAEFEIGIHLQDIAENTCDPVHFQFVHLTPEIPPSEVSVDEDGQTLHLRSEIENLHGVSNLHSKVVQPGLATVRTTYGPGAEMLVYNSAMPISREKTLLRWTLVVRNEIVDLVGDSLMEGIISGLSQDYPIWANKVHKHHPVFCPEDTPLVTYRKWVRQFHA
jgi:nitrite reductase/ring-hydroxylating ferredoxin subunit